MNDTEKAPPTHNKRYHSNSTLVGGSKHSTTLPTSNSKQQAAGMTKRGSNSLTNTLSIHNIAELDEILKDDSLLFHQRLNFIKKQINEEIKPIGLVSRDHHRTNKNGVSLEQLEKIRAKGQSIASLDLGLASPQAGANPFRRERRTTEFTDFNQGPGRGSTPKATNSNSHIFGSTKKAIGTRKMTQLQQSARDNSHLGTSGPRRSDVLEAALQDQTLAYSKGQRQGVDIDVPLAAGPGLSSSNIKIKASSKHLLNQTGGGSFNARQGIFTNE